MSVYLKYDSRSLQDGLGAQALRIMGIYSIARAFRLKYIHTEIQTTVEEFSHSKDEKTIDDTVRKFNDFFRFPSADIPQVFFKTYVFRSINRKTLLKIILRYHFTRKNVLIIVLLPFTITDSLPSLYHYASRYLRQHRLGEKRYENATGSGMLVAHVRFGYGWMYGEQAHVKKRKFLSPHYFTEVISAACAAFSLPTSTRLLIHTDLSRFDTIWKPNNLETLDGFRSISGQSGADTLRIKGRDLSYEIFVPNGYGLEIRYCADTYEAFLDMCNAQILIMGTSTFSYLAGLINSNVVVWPTIHGHSKVPDWYSELDLGLKISENMFEYVA